MVHADLCETRGLTDQINTFFVYTRKSSNIYRRLFFRQIKLQDEESLRNLHLTLCVTWVNDTWITQACVIDLRGMRFQAMKETFYRALPSVPDHDY